MTKFWKKLSEEKPYCYQIGNWDGERSEQILIYDKEGIARTAVCYQGIMDGSEFCQFFDNNDIEINPDDIVYWAEIVNPYYENFFIFNTDN